MFEIVRYAVWPKMKVRLTYWWWIIRYGGKKNIPKEVVFGQMAKSLERMNTNLQEALRHIPEDSDPEERKALYEAIEKAQNLEETAHKMFKNNQNTPNEKN